MLSGRSNRVENQAKGNIRTQDGFIYLYRNFWLMGLYTKPVKSKILYNIWRFFTIGVSIIYIPFSYLINYGLNFQKLTFGEFLFSLQTWLNCVCVSIKFIVLYFHFDLFDIAFDELDEMEKFCETEEDYQKIRDVVELGKKVTNFYLYYYFFFAFSSLTSGIVNSQPPYNTYFPLLDWRHSAVDLHLQQLFEFLSTAFVVFCAVGIDVFPVLFVLALTVHVNILKNRVAKLGTGKEKELSESERYEQLVRCIKVHKHMLKYCETIKVLMSLSIFVQFLFCGTIIGVSLVNFMVSTDTASRTAIVAYITAVLLQTFPLCYFCTDLSDRCYELADTVFHSNWMFENQRYRKTILQFLQKCQQPMIFNALNIFDINLATNISVAKFAFSVYAIAKTMRLDEKFKSYGEVLEIGMDERNHSILS